MSAPAKTVFMRDIAQALAASQDIDVPAFIDHLDKAVRLRGTRYCVDKSELLALVRERQRAAQ